MGTVESLLGRAGTIVLLGPSQEFVDALNAALYFSDSLKLVGSTADPRELRVLVERHAPDAVLVSHSLPKESGLAVSGRLIRGVSGARVILMASSPTVELTEGAISRGIRRVIGLPTDMTREAVDNWVEQELSVAVYGMIDDEPRVQPEADSPNERAKKLFSGPATVDTGARVVAVWGPKGGVGKSTIAANLALYSQTNATRPAQTSLIGLDVGTGVLSASLNMPHRPTLLDWPEYTEGDELDPMAVLGRAGTHESGLRVVFEPEVQDVPEPSPDLVRTVVRSVRDSSGSALVVLDCGSVVTGMTAAGLALAHVVLLVVEPTISCLRYTGSVISLLANRGLIEPSKLRMVVNRQPAKPDLTAAEIVSHLKFPLIGAIREDEAVRTAVNRGRTPVIHAPNGAFMRGLEEVAFKVIPGLAAAHAESRKRKTKVLGLF